MGRLPDEVHDRSLMQVMVEVAARAGVPGLYSAGRGGHLLRHAVLVQGPVTRRTPPSVNLAIERFWRWSEQGRLAIVIDTSPCTYGLKTRASLPDARRTRRASTS